MCLVLWCPLFHHLVSMSSVLQVGVLVFTVSTVWHFSFHSTISVVVLPNRVTSWWKRLLGMCLVSTIWCFGVHWWWLLLITSATSPGQNKHWTHHVFCQLHSTFEKYSGEIHFRNTLYAQPKQALDTPCFLCHSTLSPAKTHCFDT